MRTDEVLKSFDLLMKRKNQHKLSGSYEARAYREEAKRLKEHYFNGSRETGNRATIGKKYFRFSKAV